MTNIKHRLLEAADQAPGWRKLLHDTCAHISSLEHQSYMAADHIAAQDKRIADLVANLHQETVNILKLQSVPMREQNARFAIDGAIAYGMQGTNKPQYATHWLMEYWEIGQKIAAQAGQETCDSWQDISSLPYADDLVWLKHGDSIDGPRIMETDDYDRYSEWAPCIWPSDNAAPPAPASAIDVDTDKWADEFDAMESIILFESERDYAQAAMDFALTKLKAAK